MANKKTNILYLISTLKRNGPNNQLYYLIKHLDRTLFNPLILTLSPEIADSLKNSFVEDLNVRVESLNLSRFMGLFLAQQRVKSLINKYNIHILHTQGVRADRLSSSIDSTVIRLSTVRNYPQYDYPMKFGKLKGNLMLFFHRKSLHKLDLCIGVSNSVKDNLNTVLRIAKVKSVINGVDTDNYFRPDKSVKQQLRKQLSLPERAKIWISSGQLDNRKDPGLILDAFLNCFDASKEHCLVFIGSGPYEDELEKKTKGAKNVILPGRVKNVVDYLQASDYYVSASKAEGMPNAVMEAMACGLPVLLSDIAPHREIHNFDNACGVLFETSNHDSLIEAFNKVLLKDYDKQSNASVEIINNYLSAKQMSLNYQQVYEDMINQG